MATLSWFVEDACTLAGVPTSSWSTLPRQDQVRIIREWEKDVGTGIDFVKVANFKTEEPAHRAPRTPQEVQELMQGISCSSAQSTIPKATKMETPKPTDLSYEDFAKLDIRTGTIISGDPVPKSKKLLKLQVDFGPEVGMRTILAGIAGTYSIDRLLGVQVVAVLNLAPRSMMGEMSHGMLLAGHNTDNQLSLVQCYGVANGGSIG